MLLINILHFWDEIKIFVRRIKNCFLFLLKFQKGNISKSLKECEMLAKNNGKSSTTPANVSKLSADSLRNRLIIAKYFCHYRNIKENKYSQICKNLKRGDPRNLLESWMSVTLIEYGKYQIRIVQCQRHIVRRGTRRRPSVRCGRPWAWASPRWSVMIPTVPLHLLIDDPRKPKHDSIFIQGDGITWPILKSKCLV